MRKVFLIRFLLKIVEKVIDIVFPPSDTALKLRKIDGKTLRFTYPDIPQSKHNFVFSLFNYKEPFIEQMIWELKFFKNKYSAKICGQLLYQIIPKQKYILIPVPISKAKRRDKGFNQTEILCEEIIKHDKDYLLTYMPNILIKNRHTKNQHDIENRKERLINLDGAFMLTKLSVVSDQSVIIIDDVYTTGATLLEIKKVLEKAGAKNVIAITVAH